MTETRKKRGTVQFITTSPSATVYGTLELGHKDSEKRGTVQHITTSPRATGHGTLELGHTDS